MKNTISITIAVIVLLVACRSDGDCEPEELMDMTGSCVSSVPVGDDYELDIPFYVTIPTYIPSDNPIKTASVELGRHLFWDTRLSGDNTMSCGSCHSPAASFSDPVALSTGIDGELGTRNAMALVNLVFQPIVTWDGGRADLEAQSIAPVLNPIEMHETWENAVTELEADEMYAPMFEAAYGSPCIDRVRASKSIASFMRTMTSFNAKYDRARFGPESFTPLEQIGLSIWDLEGGIGGLGQEGADCFHCHSLETQIFTANDLRNNGLDSVFTDLGQGGVTGNPAQYGKFKVPSLRNIEFSAPYMHDGRFETLEQVIDHYNSGGHPSATIDANMKFSVGGLQLTEEKKAALVAFLKTFSDTEFISNPEFQDPF